MMDESFGEADFETYVENIDDTLLQAAPDLFEDYYHRLMAKNSELGIEADGSFAFRLLEYGRHRASKLSKLGMLDAIITRDEPATQEATAVRAAFELGMAAAEHRFLDFYEEYVFDGIAISEWRESGLPKARAERLRQGKLTHTAVVNAARALYQREPSLVRNDSETARRIRSMKIPALQKGGGSTVGVDAITRHLRSARQQKEL